MTLVRKVSLQPLRRPRLCLALLAAGTLATHVAAQDLPLVPGYSELQQNTANYVQRVCSSFVSNVPTYGAPNLNGTPQQKLFYSCGAMVHSANALVPGGGTNTTLNLGLTEEQMHTAVQALAPVQMNSQKQIGVEASKISALSARLFDLRSGARGFVMSMNGINVAPTKTGGLRSPGAQGASGGAAGADSDIAGKWGSFVNVAYNWGNVDRTDRQDPYSYDSINVVGGLDYRATESFVVGGALNYNYTDAKYDQNLGSVKSNTLGVAGYATYYVSNWYFDGFLSYGYASYDTTRNIFIPSSTTQPAVNAVASANPNGDQAAGSIGLGYNLYGQHIDLTPFARFTYIWVRNKAFKEDEPAFGLGLSVNERQVQSGQSALGLKLSKNFNTASGVFVPYFTAQWVHEFLNGSTGITAKYVNDPFAGSFFIPTENPDRDFGVFTVGATGTFANNLSAFVQFSAAAFLDNISNYSLVAGLRKQF